MRKLTLVMQTTLNGHVADGEGAFWEPFPYGDEEQDYANREVFDGVDTWIMGHGVWDGVTPWWDDVAAGGIPEDQPLTPALAEFGRLYAKMDKVLVSHDPGAAPGRRVLSGDLVPQLEALKAGEGGDIVVSGGPDMLAPLMQAPGLIDEYLLTVHPAVITDGPDLFGALTADLKLRLVKAKVFGGGVVKLFYAPL